MKQLITVAFSLLILTQFNYAQPVTSDCSGFSATYTTKESRCASTGSITITPSGGSGNYSYKVLAPISLPITSTSTITGLAPGSYTVQVKDMESGCTLIQDNLVVSGSYSDPRFQLQKTDLSCINSSDGTITAFDLQNGRSPFTYRIISPSPASVGVNNATGSFNGLPAGDYYIQLLDSCGGIQTRTVAIQDYNWYITSNTVTTVNCNTIYVSLLLTDNKGNTNQSSTAFNGFRYGIVNSPGDTTWNTNYGFNYTRTPIRSINIVVKDRCGIIKTVTWKRPAPALDAGVSTSNNGCSTFDVKVTNPQNFSSSAIAYLKQGSTVIQSNTTGEFTNVPYGSYCIEVRDNCYDTLISRCFSQTRPVPSVNTTVDTSNLQCSTFDVRVGGQTNLFNATYNLYNSSNTLVGTNSTGTFTSLPYGTYRMRVVSATPCYDTTIIRDFTVIQPKPVVASPSFNNVSCSNYTAYISSAQYLYNATYCIYQNGNLISCSPDGSFPGLAYGVQYCIRIRSSSPCYDTTIQHCFTRSKPAPAAGNPSISNRTCSTVTVKIPSVTNIPDPSYCLYTSANVLIECNNTGQFDNVPYGNNYYINVVTTSTTTDCPNTVVKKTFSVTRNVATVGTTINISNKNCYTFSAGLTSSNFISPKFTLYNSANDIVATSTSASPTFNNLPYGNYRVVVTSSCLDTIIRTFSEQPTPTAFALQAVESCTIGSTDVKVTFATGQFPFSVKVLNPLNTTIASQNITSTATYTFAALPALPSGMQYRVAVSSACGKNDTLIVSPKTSLFNRATSVQSKCPSGVASNGSGDINVELNSNIGMNAPKIIKRNTTTVSIFPTLSLPLGVNLARYSFLELQPATYVLEYDVSACSRKVYDTVIVAAYKFPDLANSAAYQCDNNNFSVSAVAAGGVSPFSYEVIGSNPSGIASMLQSTSVFNILTNTPYSLVRMRAVDACGNGTLNDVSVLPLGQLTIHINNVDCYSNAVQLAVDTVPNASYTWYFKKKANSTDSTLVTTNQVYSIPYLLPSDTGTYVCKTSVNNGCLQRLSYFNLKGDCSILLPVKMTSFTGKLSGNDVLLNWKVEQEDKVREYQVERSVGNASFEYIGTVRATNEPGSHQYNYTDANAPGGKLRYRLKVIDENGRHSYSKLVELTHAAVFITAAPNPVKQDLSVSISAKSEASYSIKLYNLSGQIIHQQTTSRIRSGLFRIARTHKMPPGFYLIKVENLEGGEVFTQKLIFE
jgi:hypothetical protein